MEILSRYKLMAVISLALLLVVQCPTLAPAGPPWGGIKYVRCAGGPSGSPSYKAQAIIASFLNKIQGIQASVITGAATKNLSNLNEGKAETGYTIDVNLMQQLAAGKKFDNLAFMCFMMPRGLGFFVRADSRYKTINDLKRAHIAFGPKGYGANALAKPILESYGITVDNIGKWGGRISFMAVRDSCSGLRDKTVDAQVVTWAPTGMYGAHRPLEQAFGLRLIPVDKEHLTKVVKATGLSMATLPAGTYKHQTKDYTNVSMVSIQICRRDLPDDLVYTMLEVILSKDCRKARMDMSKGHLTFILENGLIKSEVLPLHPGAAKFFKDKGISKAPEQAIVPGSVKEALGKYGGQWSFNSIKWVTP